MNSFYKSGKWTAPTIADFSGGYNDFEPCISSDGKSFYFTSARPSEGKEVMTLDFDIWKMDRSNDGWGQPKLLDGKVNTKCMEYYPSVTKEGVLYFGRNDSAMTRGDMHYAQLINEKYNDAVKLPGIVNLPNTSFNAFIDPDNKYLIFSTYVQDSSGWHSDLYISYRDKERKWTRPLSLGDKINTKANELSPWVSFDKKFLFFSSTRLDTSGQNKEHNIFWVKAAMLK